MKVSKSTRKSAVRFIVAVGIVSLFADMTYEGARGITGPFLKDLGASATAVGFIAGFGEMIAASLRFFSGRLADRTRAYWIIVALGYLLNLFAVPLLAFAGNWQAAALLVILERTGKSLRGPAQDVLLSDATEIVGHGWGFGLHSALDQTGAVLGPLFMAAIVARQQHFSRAFLWLTLPAIAAFVALAVARFVAPEKDLTLPVAKSQQLPRVFWFYVAAAGLLAAGFFDFPLLAYHFQKTALAQPAAIPLYYAGAMGVSGLFALVIGRIFDRFGTLALAFAVVISMLALPLGFLGGPVTAIIGIGCWAVGLGAQDATLRSGIAQVVSMDRRGTAFGTFNAAYGVFWFLGSVIMGVLYDNSLVALVAFGVGAQLAAAILFFWLHRPLARAAG